MSYAGNNEIIRKHFHDYQENLCITVLSIIPLRKTFFLIKVIFTQGAFKNIQGLFNDILHFKVKKAFVRFDMARDEDILRLCRSLGRFAA